MVETLRQAGGGNDALRGKQDDAQATLAPILTREDGRIDFARDAQTIFNRWRGFQPWPGAYTRFRGKKFIVHAMEVVAAVKGLAAGEMMVRERALYVGCAQATALRLDEVQMEGKKRMPVGEFLRGYQLQPAKGLVVSAAPIKISPARAAAHRILTGVETGAHSDDLLFSPAVTALSDAGQKPDNDDRDGRAALADRAGCGDRRADGQAAAEDRA